MAVIALNLGRCMHTLGIMLTLTTYGSWLRGDQRGWVDEGRVFPPDPIRQANDEARLLHPPYLFARDRVVVVKQAIISSLRQRLQVEVYAMTVQSWHVHMVVGPTPHDISVVVKCAKDAARYTLKAGRPIWTEGYDKRYCFDQRSLRARIEYVHHHDMPSLRVI